MRYIFLTAILAITACAEQSIKEDNLTTETSSSDSVIVTATVSADKEDETIRVVEWETNPADAPVTIMVDLPGAETKRIGENISKQALIFDGEENQRSYFTLSTAQGDSVKTALRVLPLEGGRNFRDLGGYETEDGRTIKWGQIYRSGVLHELTDQDYEFIADLNIGTIVDFRATEEQQDEPTEWKAGAPEILAWDYSSSDSAGQLGAIFRNPDITPSDVTNLMAGFYKGMVYDHAEKYAAMFNKLVTTDAPLAFHCSAGKDRTGVGAMLVLTALGVPRETIIEDYAMSEKVVDYMAAFSDADTVDRDSPYAFLAELPKETVRPLMRSNPVYIKAAIAQLEEDHGSVLGFIKNELDVSDEKLTELRLRLLTAE